MHTKLPRVLAIIAVLLLLRLVFNAVLNPLDTVRRDLARELEQVPGAAHARSDGPEYAALQNAIAARPALWNALIAPPEVPVETPAPTPGPTPPNMDKLLEGVSIGRGQIGENKIRVITPDAPDGQWMAIGTEIKGCRLDSFTRDEAIFTYDWKAGGKKLSLSLPRP